MAEERQEDLRNIQGTSTESSAHGEEKKNVSSIAIPGVKLRTYKSGVGKYINPSALQNTKYFVYT